MKHHYCCTQCGASFSQWAGQCSQCMAWNSLVAEPILSKGPRQIGYAASQASPIVSLLDVPVIENLRMQTGLSELDRVLGGGLIAGSVVLMGGDPGIGKSTLLLQTLACLSQDHRVLYVTGEESLQQVTLRSNRLGLQGEKLRLLAETNVEQILISSKRESPQVMVIDSIQTMYTENIPSAPGSVGQVRESAAHLLRYAKASDVALFLVGHVTKDGALAGPRVLEHMVDAVLYFEGERDSRFRVIRAIKNRFGAVNELGVFAMTEKGLREINNPSAIFLSRGETLSAGSVVMVTWEGSRPLLVEVQALVDPAYGNAPRRVTLGLEQNRLVMLLAVLHRHGGVAAYNQDVFVNIVGGVRVTEPAADLPVILAAVSSLKNKALNPSLIAFGELGLAGETRPVQNGQERLQEAVKHGFKEAIVPYANAPKKPIPGLKIHAVKHVQEALEWVC